MQILKMSNNIETMFVFFLRLTNDFGYGLMKQHIYTENDRLLNSKKLLS